MSKEKDEAAVKEIIEYANNEITKSKRKYLTIFFAMKMELFQLVYNHFFSNIFY